MKQDRNSLRRVHHDAKVKARSVVVIESALREMQAMAITLDQFVAAEEVRTRIADVKHAAYSTSTIAARARSAKLRKSITQLKTKLFVATAERDSALAVVTLSAHTASIRLSVAAEPSQL
jgi:hypothetical protein